MNENYFDTIDSDAKAYILGFFIGDGHLCSTKHNDYGIVFSQRKEDIEVLQFIKKEIDPERKIIYVNRKTSYGGKGIYYLRITNKHLHSTLSKLLNCTNKKTYEEFNLPKIKEEFIPSLIRGYFDSDGCISVSSYITKRRTKYKDYMHKDMSCV